MVVMIMKGLNAIVLMAVRLAARLMVHVLQLAKKVCASMDAMKIIPHVKYRMIVWNGITWEAVSSVRPIAK